MNDIEKENAKWIGLTGMKQQLIEECGELIKAICKYNRSIGVGQYTPVDSETAYSNMIREIVDVRICLDSLCYLMGVTPDRIEIERLDAVLKVMHRRLGDEANENV